MKNIILFATDKSTGEDRNIKAAVAALMDRESDQWPRGASPIQSRRLGRG